MASYILKLQCLDQVGIVARVSALIAKHQGWIISADQFADEKNGQFFMRVEIRKKSLNCTVETLKQALNELAQDLTMTWSLIDMEYKQRTVVFVSQQYHCLSDLLYRYISHDLEMDLVAIVSNHIEHKDYVEAHGIPFHHISFETQDNASAFKMIESLLAELSVDLIVLARFMRIFPDYLCTQYAGKIINIHHSFLPSFEGGHPYERAFDAGVKMIGATCHYVTPALDKGPIIEQDVIRINHNHSLHQIQQLCRDIEKITLAKGVRYHLEERVLINQNKTLVFT